MWKRTRIAAAVTALVVFGASRPWVAQSQEAHQHTHDPEEAGAIAAMSQPHLMGPHFKLTPTRPATAADRQRADSIVETLRNVLEPYRDSKRAERDGYRVSHADLPLPQHHFTSPANVRLAAARFDPEKPTSLLYRRDGDKWILTGVMYTAPARTSEEELDSRVPLSMARWHSHVNVCLPRQGARNADWTKFGPQGSIVSKEACDAAGGRFYPQRFGWMVHVHPFETEPERIWAH